MQLQSQTSSNKTWWELATQWSVVRRGLAYAVCVGFVLIAINHGDDCLRGDFTLRRIVKMGLTVMVPYLVSTFSSVGALRRASGSHGNDSQKQE